MTTSLRNPIDDPLSERLLGLAAGRTAPPTIARYERQLLSAESAQLRALFKKHFGYEPVNDVASCHRHAMDLWRADSLSDHALVTMLQRGNNPHATIDAFLDRGIAAITDPPAEFVALWNQVTTEPEWLDWALLERGARIYRRYGVLGFMFQGIGSIDSYRDEGIAKTLMSTGQYADDTAFKRFVLTCNFWTKVSEPGGMRPFAPGWKVAIQVRLLHTLIRRNVLGSGKWDAERLGMPINQVGLLAAPLISSVMIGQHLKMLGYRPTDDEVEAMLHLWRYVAYVMGRDAEGFPSTVEAGLQTLYELLNVSGPSDTPEGIRIGRSFFEAFKPKPAARGRERWRQSLQYRINLGQSLFFVAPATRKVMGLPNPLPWGLLYWLVRYPINRWTDHRRHASADFEEAYDRKVSRERYAWLGRALDGNRLEYRMQTKP